MGLVLLICNSAELGRWRLPTLPPHWEPCPPHLRSIFLLVFVAIPGNPFAVTGPPPADKEKIQALPTVPVTEEHVGMLTGLVDRVPGDLPVLACLSRTCFLCRLRA